VAILPFMFIIQTGIKFISSEKILVDY